MARLRRLITIEVSADIEDGELFAPYISEILRNHAAEIDDPNGIPGKVNRGSIFRTSYGYHARVDWVASYPGRFQFKFGTVDCGRRFVIAIRLPFSFRPSWWRYWWRHRKERMGSHKGGLA